MFTPGPGVECRGVPRGREPVGGPPGHHEGAARLPDTREEVPAGIHAGRRQPH